jgi:predicted alpha/beta hydrolase family esterase
MTTRVVFVQGGGPGAWEADLLLAESLRGHLGDGYVVDFPKMPDEDDPNDSGWLHEIDAAISRAAAAIPRNDDDSNDNEDAIVLVGHSAGGYLLLKFLATKLGEPGLNATKLIASEIAAICIIAAPFPGGDPDWTFDGFELPTNFGSVLPSEAAVYLYASPDDEIVPFAHRDLFGTAIPHAVTRTTNGGHQLGNDLALVADDIRSSVGAPQ